MYVAIIRKIPKPDKKEAYIAYLTNVHTLKEYRNDKGTELLTYIKEYLSEIKCELTITWPSENSIDRQWCPKSMAHSSFYQHSCST